MAPRCARRSSAAGTPVDAAALRAAADGGQVKVIAIVLAETSMGLLQPLDEIAALARELDALLVVDAVTALGGMPVPVEALGLDAVYTCTQKCLGAPPGLAPITLSARAVAAIEARTTPVQSWYLDLLALQRYWSAPHTYHHTANVSLVYALHTALRLALEEGLPTRYARHALHGEAFQAGAAALGLRSFPAAAYQLPMLAALRVPAGVDAVAARRTLLLEESIEIGVGLGDLASSLWRVGLLGYNAERRNVLHLLGALERLLPRVGHAVTPGAGIAAAEAVYVRQSAC